MKLPLLDAVAYAEDDYQRSCHARQLIQTTRLPSPELSPASTSIPKVIVQFWDDLTRMPEDVKECISSWESLLEHGFKKLIFDDCAAKHFIARNYESMYVKAFERCHHPAMRCDYFRLCYILLNGGFYVDADEVYQGGNLNSFFNDNSLKLQPLCYDAETGTMVDSDVFINNKHHSSKWIFYFNNNPIISPARHPIIRLALNRATKILTNADGRPEIQSTTGPGNLTASVVAYTLSQGFTCNSPDLFILSDWDAISISRWPLSYRNDERNWRIANERAYRNSNQ